MVVGMRRLVAERNSQKGSRFIRVQLIMLVPGRDQQSAGLIGDIANLDLESRNVEG